MKYNIHSYMDILLKEVRARKEQTISDVYHGSII